MRITQGTFSYLPDLTDEEITAQVQYALDRGWPISVEFTDDPHPRNTYWEMWGLPMFDIRDAAAVRDALASTRDLIAPPARLLEFVGAGINAWTAAEGALKARETSYVATEGMAVEQYVHGPSVAVGPLDQLVVLDGGGPWRSRLDEAAEATAQSGAVVHRVDELALGEPLSIFPLTARVQRIALELSETLGTNPDTFGAELPGHERWTALEY